MKKSHFAMLLAAPILAKIAQMHTSAVTTDQIDRDDQSHLDRAARRRIQRQDRKTQKKKMKNTINSHE